MRNPSAQCLDGQAAALAMLRRLQQMNWVRMHRKKSTALLASAVASLHAWPEAERMRFLAVLADWLASDAIGSGYDLDNYEEWIRRKEAKRSAREAKYRDRGFQQFLASVQGSPTSPTT